MTSTTIPTSTLLIARLYGLLCCCLLLSLPPAPLNAQGPGGFDGQEENLARGFDPNKVFASGDIDQINTFNGNLVLSLPIGQSYSTGDFSYSLNLRYNSAFWDFDRRHDPVAEHCNGFGASGPRDRVRAWPALDSNAGLGWQLSLGRLYGPNDLDYAGPELAVHKGDGWTYIGADGNRRRLFATLHGSAVVEPDPDDLWYTRDGSYLRLKGTRHDPVVTLEFPDGMVHAFEKIDPILNVYRVTKLMDRRELLNPGQGNFLIVDYSPDGLQWILSDSVGRTHTLQFEDPGTGPYEEQRLKSVALTAFGGQTATYTFEYANHNVERDCSDDDPDTPLSLPVSLLTKVHLPDGTSYEATYDLGSDCQQGGKIETLTLSTGGKVEWDFGVYTFPSRSATCNPNPVVTLLYCVSPTQIVPGVVERRLFAHRDDASPIGVWTYRQELVEEPLPAGCPSLSGEPVESRTVVTNPLGNATPLPTDHQTVHHYSAYKALKNTIGDLRKEEYGLPFTRTETDSSGTRYLSTEVFDETGARARATYVRYAMDQLSEGEVNKRVTSSRTLFEDGRFADVIYSDYDGLGHYRRQTTGGNFGDGDVKTSLTNYNPGRGSFCGDPAADPDCDPGGPSWVPPSRDHPWILDLYDLTQVEERGERATRLACFDGDTGDLLGERTLVSGALSPSEGPNDLLTLYGVDTAGNVLREQIYGGDLQSLPSGVFTYDPLGGCSAGPVALHAAYRIDRDYQAGSLATSRYVDDCSATTVLSLADHAIDPNSGLVAESRDPAGVLTQYSYDLLGRLTRQEPGQDAHTVYTYDLLPTPPTVDVRTTTPFGSIITQSVFKYDGLGRLVRSEQRLPDPAGGIRWSGKNLEYNALGWKLRESELEVGANPQHWTVLEYDAFGRVKKVTAPDSSQIETDYTGVQGVRRRTRIDGQPSELTELYDRQNRLVTVTEPSGTNGSDVTTHYTYDYADRLIGVTTSAEGATQYRTFTYDPRGFLLTETHPEIGAAVIYSSYDAGGNVGRQEVSGGPRIDYTYDRAARVTQVHDGRQNRLLKELVYGASNFGNDLRQGKLVQAKRHNYLSEAGTPTDVVITESFTYAGRSGRVSEARTRSSRGLAFVQSYAYDRLGNVAETLLPSCDRPPCAASGVGPARQVVSEYDEGLLVRVAADATDLATLTYHPNTLLFEVRHSNGVTATQTTDPSNGMARPAAISFDGPGLAWGSGVYSYDEAGNVVAIGADDYRYDLVGRLTSGTLNSVAGAGSQSLEYDSFGNITRLITAGVEEPIIVDPATNRLAMPGALYDVAGNLTQWRGLGLSYDPLNMVSRIEGLGVNRSFLYNASDERVATLDLIANEELWTVRDLANRVQREFTLDPASRNVSWGKDYLYRGNLLLASASPSGARHFHLDHLGSTRRVTDGATAATLAEYVYYPFGGLALDSGTDRLLFAGHERDRNCESCLSPELDDLDYMHIRYYSPNLGRFLSVDPVNSGELASPQSWNKHSYVQNNPLTYIDPNGRSRKRVHDYHTRTVLSARGFSEAQIRAVVSANLRSDSLFGQRLSPRSHATALFLSDTESSSRGNKVAGHHLNRAIALSRAGDEEGALQALGRALHTAEDVVAHRGLGNLLKTVTSRLDLHARQDESVKIDNSGNVVSVPDPVASAFIQALLDAIVVRFLKEGVPEPESH